MHAFVDPHTCIGCGLCASSCPEVFRMTDDGVAEAYTPGDGPAQASTDAAIEACPVSAISWED